jgi:SAM-dependent methyltransferase
MTREMYFQTRFVQDAQREVLWQTLCRYYFNRLINPTDCVLELGTGYACFINAVAAGRRIAVDSWEGFPKHLVSGIESHVGDVTDLGFLKPSSVNFVFASNLFEHVSQEAFASVLQQLKSALARGGTLNILQPNYYYAYREYFDDYTHRTVYTHKSICDFLEAYGYEVMECHPRFLPLTVKSRLPVSPILIRLYLALPWKPMGKQMFIRARVK